MTAGSRGGAGQGGGTGGPARATCVLDGARRRALARTSAPRGGLPRPRGRGPPAAGGGREADRAPESAITVGHLCGRVVGVERHGDGAERAAAPDRRRTSARRCRRGWRSACPCRLPSSRAVVFRALGEGTDVAIGPGVEAVRTEQLHRRAVGEPFRRGEEEGEDVVHPVWASYLLQGRPVMGPASTPPATACTGASTIRTSPCASFVTRRSRDRASACGTPATSGWASRCPPRWRRSVG